MSAFFYLEDCMRECMRRVYEESLCEECVRLERNVRGVS